MVIISNNNYLKLHTKIQFTGIFYCKNYKSFIKNNMWHRYYGPSVIYFSYVRNEWWFNDRVHGSTVTRYNQEQFLKGVNRLWLL